MRWVSPPAMTSDSTKTFWRRDRIAGVALILLGAVIAWEGRRLPMGTWHNPGAGYLPMLLAAFLALFGAVIAAMDRASPPMRRLGWSEAPHGLLIVLACGAAAFLLERIGYRLTIFLLVLFFLALVERRHIVMSLAVAAGMSTGSYALFATMLRVPLPLGPWGW
jgi:hypothetical protein